MKDQLISTETANLAYKKGFRNHSQFPNSIYYSTQSVLQKWLREVHDIHILIEPYVNNHYEYNIISELIEEYSDKETYYDIYEEALEAALQGALKLIK